MELYNTLTKKKEEFKPIKRGYVGIYTCGPTVYFYQHIGNLRTYIFSDILKKVLQYNGYKIKQVMNITDVGHLTSDSDSGKDKIEEAAKREHKTAKEISNFYWKIFRNDLKKLNVSEPTKWCKATEHIKEQINLIKLLEKKDFTYKTSDGIYFDTSKLKDYGKLARLKIEDLEAGKRTKVREKINKTDFALWKFSEKPGIRQQEWNSPWGIGFPGWHIECSAMSSKYLGKQFDIHTGGEDHIPIHHTNEIAQSESAFEKKPWVKYWLHGAFLIFKGEKVSKSKGGFYTISELEELEYNPLSYRYLCLTTHYRSKLNFSIKALKNAQNSYKRLKNIITNLKNDDRLNKEYLQRFEKSINDDLDMPKALAVLWNLVRDKKAQGKINTIKRMDKVFCLNLLRKEKIKLSKQIKKLIQERDKARKKKDWIKSDKIRTDLAKKGVIMEDTPKGIKIIKS